VNQTPKPSEPLPVIDWAALRHHLPVEAAADGHVFFREGEESHKGGRAFYAVILGQIEISSEGAGGRVPIVRTLKPGDIFGLVGFLATAQHTATCKAKGETQVVIITAEKLKELQSKNPVVHTQLLWACANQLARDLRACNERLLTALGNARR